MVDHTPEPIGSTGQPPAARPLKAALELVAAGYYVAPVIIRRDPKTGKKIGDYLGVKWHDQATLDPAVVTDWWAQYQCSFLVDTGRSGVFAVDLDVPPTGMTGEMAWNQAGLPGSVGDPYSNVQRARTPGGGIHLWFRAPAGETLTVHKRIHGLPIDVRADGGHVYAPGSAVLDASGEPELRGYELDGPLIPAAQLAELPEAVATFLHAERGQAKRTPSAQGEVRTRTWIVEACRAQLERVSTMERREGSGFRSAVNGAAMVLGRAVAAGLLSEQAAVKRLEKAVSMVWGTPDRDDRRWIRHGLEDGQADPWTMVPDDYDTTVSTVADRNQASSGVEVTSMSDPNTSTFNLSNGGAEVEPESPSAAVRADSADSTADSPDALGDDGPDSWAPVDLGPFLDGEVVAPRPAVGVVREDGARILYAGMEHAVIGAMEAGKSWFALACVAAELTAGHRCIYVHFEEGSPRATIERLRLFGVATEVIRSSFTFVGPERRVTVTDVERLLAAGAPTLVVLDGQNEAMALHGQEIMAPEGAAEYRRKLVKPFTRAGAAVVSLDHVVKDAEAAREGYALGSAHKGNGLDGALILLENYEPFGRGRDGVSGVSVTKDRPAALRQLGQQRDPRNPRKFFIGTMHVQAAPGTPGGWAFRFAAPGQPDVGEDPEFAAMREERRQESKLAELEETVLAVVRDLDGKGIDVSGNKIVSLVTGKRATVLDAVHRLEAAGRLKNSNPGGSPRWIPTHSEDQ